MNQNNKQILTQLTKLTKVDFIINTIIQLISNFDDHYNFFDFFFSLEWQRALFFFALALFGSFINMKS